MYFDFDIQSERYIASNKRLWRAYMRQPQEQTPVVEPNVLKAVYSPRETWQDLDKMLVNACGLANNLALTENDWPPVISCYCTVVMVPSAFGCEIIFPSDQDPWARHRLSGIEQVYNLKPQKPRETPLIKRQLDWIEYAQRHLGTAVPMWMPDMQSPFSVAAQIVEPEELFLACHINPQAVHHLCQMITDYTIEVWDLILTSMEHPGFPGANYPCISENIGLCLADDTPLIMLSPAFYEEFALPYNCQLGHNLKGIHIHSCGNYQHNLDNVMKISNIRSIQVHAGPGEFPLPLTVSEDCPFNRARKKCTYFVDVNSVSRGDMYCGKYKEYYVEYLLPRLNTGDMTGCILQGCGCDNDAGLMEISESLRWTRKQLCLR